MKSELMLITPAVETCEFEASIGSIVSSRPAWTKIRDHILTKQKQNIFKIPK